MCREGQYAPPPNARQAQRERPRVVVPAPGTPAPRIQWYRGRHRQVVVLREPPATDLPSISSRATAPDANDVDESDHRPHTARRAEQRPAPRTDLPPHARADPVPAA